MLLWLQAVGQNPACAPIPRDPSTNSRTLCRVLGPLYSDEHPKDKQNCPSYLALSPAIALTHTQHNSNTCPALLDQATCCSVAYQNDLPSLFLKWRPTASNSAHFSFADPANPSIELVLKNLGWKLQGASSEVNTVNSNRGIL